jgi:small-conductance mechanosensitive channel
VNAGILKERNRPWRAIITFLCAIGAAIGVHLAGAPLRESSRTRAASRSALVSLPVGHLITVAGTIVFFIFALICVFAFASWGQDVLERFIGAAYGAILRYAVILLGIAIVLLAALSLLGFRVGELLVGGAVTGVLITIAAQQSLANLFAGVMLQFARPFRVGERVLIRSGALGGTIEGTVAEFSITYVWLETDDGRVLLPNSQVLAAAISPAPRAELSPASGGTAPTEPSGSTALRAPGSTAPPQSPEDPAQPPA